MKLATAVALLASALSGAAAAEESAASPDAGAPPGASAPPAAPAVTPAPVVSPAARRFVYLAFRGGAYRPSGDATAVFDPRGLDLEVAVGLPLTRHIAVEGGVGWYASGMAPRSIAISSGPDAAMATLQRDLAVVPITATVRASARAARFAFSFIAGAGIHLATMQTTVSSPLLGTSSTHSGDDRALGVHVGGGVELDVSERISVGIEIRRTFVDAVFDAVFIDESTSTSAKGGIEVDGVRGGATLVFRL